MLRHTEVAEKILQNEDALTTVAVAISNSLETQDKLAAAAANVAFETVARLGTAMSVIVSTSTAEPETPRHNPLGESTSRAKLLNNLQLIDALRQHHQSKKQRGEAEEEQNGSEHCSNSENMRSRCCAFNSTSPKIRGSNHHTNLCHRRSCGSWGSSYSCNARSKTIMEVL